MFAPLIQYRQLRKRCCQSPLFVFHIRFNYKYFVLCRYTPSSHRWMLCYFKHKFTKAVHSFYNLKSLKAKTLFTLSPSKWKKKLNKKLKSMRIFIKYCYIHSLALLVNQILLFSTCMHFFLLRSKHYIPNYPSFENVVWMSTLKLLSDNQFLLRFIVTVIQTVHLMLFVTQVWKLLFVIPSCQIYVKWISHSCFTFLFALNPIV